MDFNATSVSGLNIAVRLRLMVPFTNGYLFSADIFRESCSWVLGCWYLNWALWPLNYSSCTWNKGNC